MDQSLQNKQNIPPNYDVIFIWSALKKLSLHDIFVNIIKCGLDWIFCVNRPRWHFMRTLKGRGVLFMEEATKFDIKTGEEGLECFFQPYNRWGSTWLFPEHSLPTKLQWLLISGLLPRSHFWCSQIVCHNVNAEENLPVRDALVIKKTKNVANFPKQGVMRRPIWLRKIGKIRLIFPNGGGGCQFGKIFNMFLVIFMIASRILHSIKLP